jgi:DNA-binding protein HU-beta
MPTRKLTAEIIHAAIEGFESQKRRIDSQIDELRQLLSTDRTEAAPASGAPAPKRKISAAGRRRMAAAQQARWAKARGETEPAESLATPKPTKQKRELSEAGRKAISEATKKRWALKKAEAQKAQTAVTKKAAAKKTGAKKPRKKAHKAPQAAVTPAAQ